MSRSRVAIAALILSLPVTAPAQTYPAGNDPRNGLKYGMLDAGEAAEGMRLVSFTPKAAEFDTVRGLTFINSDIAFGDHYVYQGNFSGFSIWDVSNPVHPVMVSAVACVTSQGDPSIVGNLLFISAEGGGNRNDCAKGGVQNPADHMAGVRIYDVSNPATPRLVKNVQTCKGSHTHTVIPSPTDKGVVYIYVSGSQFARPDSEMTGCVSGSDPADERNSLYRLDVIKVPLAHPEEAEVVTGARIFTGLAPAPRRQSAAQRERERAATSARRRMMTTSGPWNCHDVTAYPAMNVLAGACASYGLLVDISNPERPVRLDARSDTNFSLWHTAVFSNDGSKVVFTDEWGGGLAPNCQQTSMLEMGGNTTLTISRDRKFTQRAYFKIPSAQSPEENCVSHNGGLVPVPGRDIMVQGWYQGGVDVIDFTDPDHPFEIAYFDRGPVDAPPTPGDTTPAIGRQRGSIGGSWGAYYWNGLVYSSELARGLDVLELLPTAQLSANELAAARLVRFEEYNPQSQPKIVWPAAFPVVRSYLDQLIRNNGLPAVRTRAITRTLDTAEKQSGPARRATLTRLAAQVDADARTAKDAARARAMAAAIRDLAAAST